MENKRKFETGFIASLLVAVILLSGALAVIFYQLDKSSTWKVNVDYGLKLTDKYDVEVSTIDFIVNRYGSQTKELKIKNLSNNAVNVTQIMPLNTAYYTFTTTFANSTILKDGSVTFNITLTDIDMNAETLYGGQFSWLIVDVFEP